MHRLLVGCLAGILTLAFCPLALEAQPIPLRGEFLIPEVTVGQQGDPRTAFDDQGNFMVVWFSAGAFNGPPSQDGSGATVLGRRYDSVGNPLTGEFQINTTTADDQLFPDVAIDGAGRAIVAWGSGPNGQADVFAQRFNADGYCVPCPLARTRPPRSTLAGTKADKVGLAEAWNRIRQTRQSP